MRITESLKYLTLGRQVSRSQGQLATSVESIATGERFHRTSDAPPTASAAQRLRATVSRHEAFLDLSGRLDSELTSADDALQTAGDVFVRARELALQMGGSTQQDVGFDGAAKLVSELKELLRGAANTTFDDNHLFGGIADQTPPFDPTGAFVGSSRVRSVRVGDSIEVTQVSGADVFTASGGLDTFSVLDDLEAALAAHDQDAILATLGDLESAHEQINAGRLHLGAQFDILEHANAFSETMVLTAVGEESRLTDTDYASAISKMEASRDALQATAEASKRTRDLNIFTAL